MHRLKDIRGLKYPEECLIRFFFKHNLQSAPGRVLEAGCANGCNLMLFREFGWETVGIDINPASLADAEANFAAMQAGPGGYRFLQHDLTSGLPEGLQGKFDAILFPSSLYYIPRHSMVQVLCDARRLVRPGAAFYLRMRTLRDFRFGRGEPIELHGLRLNIETTSECGAINVFYQEHELVDMLRQHLGVDSTRMKILHVDCENVQNDVVVSNSDLVLWGRLPGE